MRKSYIVGALALFFTSCKPSVIVTVPNTSGDAVFTTYLAIGNSLTAGYADGSLYVTGQLNSYPNRLHEQFVLVTDHGTTGDFIQPLMHGDMGYPQPRKVVGFVHGCLGDTSIGPVDLPNWGLDNEDAKPYVSPGPNGEINNIAVPGIRVSDYGFATYGSVNPYAKRFYHDQAGTPLDELQYRVSNLHPTFFTMWLGANDVLGYALAGGQGDGSGAAAPILPGLWATNDITPASVFQTNYNNAVRVATSVGARGALLNVPDIATIPFFTTIPSNGLYISRQSLADSLTAYYRGSLNYVFRLGNNQFMIKDHAGNLRQSVPGELILLTAPIDSITCLGMGSYSGIPNQYVLTTDEIQNIRSATTRYNDVISQAATRNNLAYVDMFSYMGTLQSGITFNGINYNASYIAGGAFSLDGIHLTPRGYALVANKVLEAVNTKFHSTVPLINVNKYQGVLFP